jgi:hypothetical protein
LFRRPTYHGYEPPSNRHAEGIFEYLLAFMFVSLVGLSLLYVAFGLVTL